MTNKMLLFFGLIGLFIFIGGWISDPYNHFWRSDIDKKITWCQWNKPQFNLSRWGNKVEFCYEEGWQYYCKMSYPDYCPKGEQK